MSYSILLVIMQHTNHLIITVNITFDIVIIVDTTPFILKKMSHFFF